jgi:hypothetical protein
MTVSYASVPPAPTLRIRDLPDVAGADHFSTPDTTVLYEYDFGDRWEHAVTFETVFPPEPGVKYPRCIAGERRCPPEDIRACLVYAHRLVGHERVALAPA